MIVGAAGGTNSCGLVMARRVMPMELMIVTRAELDRGVYMDMRSESMRKRVFLDTRDALKLASLLEHIRGRHTWFKLPISDRGYIRVDIEYPDATILMCTEDGCGRIDTDADCPFITEYPELVRGWFP